MYIGSNTFDTPQSGTLWALNAQTGTEIWHYGTASGETSSPAVANGVVYIGSDGYSVSALKASTGSLLWTYQTGNYVDGSPSVVNGRVFVAAEDHKIYSFGL